MSILRRDRIPNVTAFALGAESRAGLESGRCSGPESRVQLVSGPYSGLCRARVRGVLNCTPNDPPQTWGPCCIPPPGSPPEGTHNWCPLDLPNSHTWALVVPSLHRSRPGPSMLVRCLGAMALKQHRLQGRHLRCETFFLWHYGHTLATHWPAQYSVVNRKCGVKPLASALTELHRIPTHANGVLYPMLGMSLL